MIAIFLFKSIRSIILCLYFIKLDYICSKYSVISTINSSNNEVTLKAGSNIHDTLQV